MISGVTNQQLVQAIPVAISTLSKSALSWSADNHLAFATQHAAYIFDFHITTDELNPFLMYSRFVFPASTKINENMDTEIDAKSLMDNWHRFDNHQIMLDAAMSANNRVPHEVDPRNRNASIAMPGGEPNHSGYKKALWSPRLMDDNDQCLLSLQSYNHKIIIMSQQKLNWVEVLDLSSIWNKWLIENKWSLENDMKSDDSLSKSKQYMQHRNRLKILSIADVIWSPLFSVGMNNFAFLISATESGHIVVWKINKGLKIASGSKLSCIFYVGLENITCLLWFTLNQHQALLVCGSVSGNILINKVTIEDDQVTIVSCGYLEDMDDRLSVVDVKLLPMEDENLFVLITAKQNYLFASIICLDKEKLVTVDTTINNIGHLNITTLHYDTNKIYLSSMDGRVTCVDMEIVDNKFINLKESGVIFESKGIAYNYLVTSPNKVFWAILETVSIAYDHLVIREPTQMSIYLVSSVEQIKTFLSSTQLSLPLYCYADVFEAFRLCIHKGEENIIDFPEVDKISDQSIRSSKVSLWLLKILLNYYNYTGTDLPESYEEIKSTIETHIIQCKAYETLNKYLCNENLDEEEQQSAKLICKWFSYTGGDLSQDDIMNIFEKVTDQDSEESCLICKDDVPLDNLIFGKCTKGHSLPRCMQTLLTTRPICQCKHCHSFINQKLLGSDSANCIYCETPMKLKVNR